MRNFVGFEIVGAFSAEGGISNMVVSSDISDHGNRSRPIGRNSRRPWLDIWRRYLSSQAARETSERGAGVDVRDDTESQFGSICCPGLRHTIEGDRVPRSISKEESDATVALEGALLQHLAPVLQPLWASHRASSCADALARVPL
ncbi:hypothetical protein Q5P01_000016 [Channa striata]|uniref:Uncharacterized protein n=1 Tax=Channa striata TaxID=64152 RepID=A0AA88LEH4_CHASR|nr:hypothetical protein Q5P01_000016 [Channa striata]